MLQIHLYLDPVEMEVIPLHKEDARTYLTVAQWVSQTQRRRAALWPEPVDSQCPDQMHRAEQNAGR